MNGQEAGGARGGVIPRAGSLPSCRALSSLGVISPLHVPAPPSFRTFDDDAWPGDDRRVHWTFLDDCVQVFYASGGDFGAADFERWLHDLEERPFRAILAGTGAQFTLGSAQRRRATDVFKKRGLAVAVATDSGVVRGLVTAGQWLGVRELQAFPWSELEPACASLRLEPALARRAASALYASRAAVEAELASSRRR
jgi:hypothetical protein